MKFPWFVVKWAYTPGPYFAAVAAGAAGAVGFAVDAAGLAVEGAGFAVDGAGFAVRAVPPVLRVRVSAFAVSMASPAWKSARQQERSPAPR